MSFNALSICFEMCTLCAVRRRWLGLTAYVRFMSSTCPAVAPFPTPLCRLTPVDRLDSNRIEWIGQMEGRQRSSWRAFIFIFCFRSQPSNNSTSWNGSVKAKPNRRVPSCELTCHFRVGRPFQRSFHSCAQFIYSNSLHTSKPDNNTHSTQCHVSGGEAGEVEGWPPLACSRLG